MSTTRRIIALVSMVIVFGASVGSAVAGPFNVNKNGTYVQVPPTAGSQSTGAAVAPTIVRVTAGSAGFNWGDAAIGAGAIVAIVAVVLGGGLVVTEHRHHIGHA